MTSPSTGDVVLALEADLAELLGLGPRADVEQLVPVDHLGADEPALEVGVDAAGALRAPSSPRRTSRPGSPCRRSSGTCAGRAGGTRCGPSGTARPRRARSPRASRRARRDPRSIAASASSWTHMPMTSTLSPASLNSARDAVPRPRGSRSSSSSPTLTTASTGRLVSRKYGCKLLALVGLRARPGTAAGPRTARRRRPAARRARRRASCRASTGAWPG